MREQFTPSQEEIIKAEEMATPEQEAASEVREKFKFQEHDPWDDFMEHIDQNAERRPPTAEEKGKMNRNIVQLGKMFKGSNVQWHIDGALNISLMRGEYIGIHKDIDASIEEGDLEKLDAHLEKRGYGLFLSYPKEPTEPEGKKIMERVGAKAFREASSEQLIIAAVDEAGKLRDEETINSIDIHLIRRNEEGSPIGWSEIPLPKKWFEAQSINFKGQEIHLSHPNKVAYHKLHGTRSYDRTDLRALAETGKILSEDVDEIEGVLEQELTSRQQKAEDLLRRVSEKVQPEMSAEQIFDIFANEPIVAKSIKDIEKSLKKLSKKIAESEDKSFKQIHELTFTTFNIQESLDKPRKKVQEFREWVSKTNKIPT